MARVALGDAQAFARLLDRRWGSVYLYANRMLGDPDQAADVAQEAFVRLWQQRSTWVGTGSAALWLARTTRNLVISDRRRWKLSMRWLEGPGREEERPPRTPLQEAEDSEIRIALERAIGDLAPRRREVFVLFHQQNLSHREIGEIMGIRPQSVANHLQHALADLREAMQAFLPGRTRTESERHG